MKKRRLFVFLTVIMIATMISSTALAQGQAPLHRKFLPVNPQYAHIKAQIDEHVPQQVNIIPEVSLSTPGSFISWAGLSAGGSSPSDSTGAIGPDRYIEVVNSSVAVYNRSGGLISSATQANWTGISSAGGDGVIMWSPHDNRFFAAMLSVSSRGFNTTYQLIYGFSKTSQPTASRSTWCFYNSNFGGRYGSNIPDYPKLGDTANFMLMGVNVFNNAGTAYLGADVAWVKKPALGNIGNKCPSPSSLASGTFQNLLNGNGSQASTPNPAKQTDFSSTGYVVANQDNGASPSTVLTVYTVTGTSTPSISGPTTVTVPSYSYPPSAPQPATSAILDTLDARLMSAWVSPDPAHSGALGLWTGHTVASASGRSEFRWYEINPTSGALYQSGTVNDSSLYVFMGAISPDRNGTSGTFGSNALMSLNTSSSTTFPSAAMVSVVGGVQSSIVNIFTSPASDNDFTCVAPYGPPCRWGDYSGASPDPASTTTGQVWMTVQTNGASGNPSWTTRNWAATP